MVRSEYEFSSIHGECWRRRGADRFTMTPLDQHVEAVVAMLRGRGGHVKLDLHAPEHVKRAFLQMMMECKGCRAALLGEHDGQAN